MVEILENYIPILYELEPEKVKEFSETNSQTKLYFISGYLNGVVNKIQEKNGIEDSKIYFDVDELKNALNSYRRKKKIKDMLK